MSAVYFPLPGRGSGSLAGEPGCRMIPQADYWRGGRAVEGARLESVYTLIAYRGFESLPLRQLDAHVDLNQSMAVPAGPLATISCEPRQARKGAAVTVASGAGVRLTGAAALPLSEP